MDAAVIQLKSASKAPLSVKAKPNTLHVIEFDGRPVTDKAVLGKRPVLLKAGKNLLIQLDGQVLAEVQDFYTTPGVALDGVVWGTGPGNGLSSTAAGQLSVSSEVYKAELATSYSQTPGLASAPQPSAWGSASSASSANGVATPAEGALAAKSGAVTAAEPTLVGANAGQGVGNVWGMAGLLGLGAVAAGGGGGGQPQTEQGSTSGNTGKTDNTPSPSAQQLALNKIDAWAADHSDAQKAPTRSDYEAAGVSGVNDSNLAAVNTAIAALNAGQADSVDEINAVVAALSRDNSGSNSGNNSGGEPPPDPQLVAMSKIGQWAQGGHDPALQPTLSDYANAGVQGVDAKTLYAVNLTVAAAGLEQVQTQASLQEQVDFGVAFQKAAQASIQDWAITELSAPLLETYLQAGYSGVNVNNLTAVNAALKSASAAEVQSVDQVQALISNAAQLADVANAALTLVAEKLLAYAHDNANPAPTLDDYLALGVLQGPIDPATLGQMNAALGQMGDLSANNLNALRQQLSSTLGDAIGPSLVTYTLLPKDPAAPQAGQAGAAAYYKAGDVLHIKAVFDHPIISTDDPYLELRGNTIGDSYRLTGPGPIATPTSEITYSFTVGSDWVYGEQALQVESIWTAGMQGATGWQIHDLFHGQTAADSVPSYVDVLAPTLADPGQHPSSPSSPTDNATGVAMDANIVINFAEKIQAGNGLVILKNLSDGSSLNIPIDDAQISIDNSGDISQLTINPGSNLLAGKNYAVQIEAGALTDLAGNPFAGIQDDTSLNFKTKDMALGWSVDLGSEYGQLIAPIQVEGKTYYFWDHNGNGRADTAGSQFNGKEDTISLQWLSDTFFSGQAITEANRTFNLGGLQVKLPTYGGPALSDFPNGQSFLYDSDMPGTPYDANLEQMSPGYYRQVKDPQLDGNSSYNDLLAIFDGLSVGDTSQSLAAGSLGVPANWMGGVYWSASPMSDKYLAVRLNDSYGGDRVSALPAVYSNSGNTLVENKLFMALEVVL